MAETKVIVEISETEMREAIVAGLMNALSDERRDKLIRSVIAEMLTPVVSSRTGKREPSTLTYEMGRMIQDVAREEIKKLFDAEVAPRVQQIVKETFNVEFKDDVVTQFRDAFTRATMKGVGMIVQVVPKRNEDDDR
jgi:hypothetical protein